MNINEMIAALNTAIKNVNSITHVLERLDMGKMLHEIHDNLTEASNKLNESKELCEEIKIVCDLYTEYKE